MFNKALKFVTTLDATAGTANNNRDGGENGSEDNETFVDAPEAHLHPDAHPDGGLGCSDLQLLERQRGAILEVMKSLGKNLLTGNFDLLKISLPVKLFEPRSYLEKLADPWIYSRFLHLAAEAGRNNNPVLRMKYVITYMIAGFHRVFLKWAKPYNPILGETWQASLPDGTSIFLEQISHHPPISAFQMFGRNKEYYFHGLSQPVVGYKANAIKTSAKGYRRIEFADGGAIDMTFPAYYIKGIVYAGAPRSELGGTAEFIDKQNGLRAVIFFQKVDSSVPGENTSGGSGGAGRPIVDKNNPLLLRNDAVSGTIYRTKVHHHIDEQTPPESSSMIDNTKREQKERKSSSSSSTTSIFRSKSSIINSTNGNKLGSSHSNSNTSSAHGGSGSRFGLIGKSFSNFRRTTSSSGFDSDPSGTITGEVRIPVAHCTGNWLAYLDWDGERFWTLNEEEGSAWVPDAHPLPSDTRFREDLALLLTEDVAAAQVAKEALENRQRADAKLRKA